MKLFLKSVLLFSFLLTTLQSYAAIENVSEKNRKNVITFYNLAFNKKDFVAASAYLSASYIQHSPHVADGLEGLKNFIHQIREQYPNTYAEIKRSFVDGDYVILQVHFVMQPKTLDFSTIDIFRLEQGKIIEHWGVSQNIPEKSMNSNGIF